MSSKSLDVSLFDLEATLLSGQVFHWSKQDGTWQGLIDRTPAWVRQEGDRLYYGGIDRKQLGYYFALDHPLAEIYATFPQDPYSQQALNHCRGLRIMRQPIWECLATFLTSSMKQVRHIAQMSAALRENFGEKTPGSPLYTYPSVTTVAGLSEAQLRACGLGFRAKYVAATARLLVERGWELSDLQQHPTEELRAILCELPGVGRKIANCVLLFAYGRLESVPVDVWIERVTTKMRGRGKAVPLKLEEYAQKRFGVYAGYVQQYLFHYARSSKQLPGS